ncbi:MAG: HAD hydrolase-like protein [Bacteroidales bacterium]|nr:HAD hydrolase-like protein [Bacteroidales bacterium]
MMKQPDALIFDMDGTLWNAVDAYVTCWNEAFLLHKIPIHFEREDLEKHLGKEIKKILKEVLPEYPEEVRNKFFASTLQFCNNEVLKKHAFLFPYVKEGLALLSSKYKLLMLSNCEKGDISKMMRFGGVDAYITDYIEYGMNYLPKYRNMQLLKDRNSLQNPVYIGDTDGDRIQSDKAGIPFIFVSYGHGYSENYSLRFDSFKALTDYFMQL